MVRMSANNIVRRYPPEQSMVGCMQAWLPPQRTLPPPHPRPEHREGASSSPAAQSDTPSHTCSRVRVRVRDRVRVRGRQHIITGCVASVASVARPAAGVNFCQPNIGCVSHLHHCHWSPPYTLQHTSCGCHVQVILSLSFYSVMYFRAAKYDEDCRYKSLEFSLDKTD